MPSEAQVEKPTFRGTVWSDLGRHSTCSAAAVLLLVWAALVPGCITAAVTAVVVHVIGSTGGETATVQVEAPPGEVYAAMLRVVEADPAVKLEDKDDEEMTVSVSRGKETAKGAVKLLENGHTELTVQAKSPEGRTESTGLARKAATRVCEELKVPYRLVEK